MHCACELLPTPVSSVVKLKLGKGVRALACVASLSLAVVTCHAAPNLGHVVCQVTYGGETQTLDAIPTADPYVVSAVDIAGRFRFKLIALGTIKQLEAVKIYVYAHDKTRDTLLQEARYLASELKQSESFTGHQYLYSAPLGRELQYSCSLGSTPAKSIATTEP